MADVTLAISGVEDTPLDYPVPGAAELLIKVLAATYNGSGAAGNFVPAIKLYIGGTSKVATFPLGQTLAAGASADVAWFRGGGLDEGGGGSPLTVTDGVTVVDPADEILVSTGLKLTNPSSGVAEVASSLEVTDGVTVVQPATEITVDSSITLTQPSTGVAAFHVTLPVGSAGAVAPFYDHVLSSAVASVTVSVSAANGNNLVVYATFQSNAAAPFVSCLLQFNGDSGANYMNQITSFDAGGVQTTSTQTNGAYWELPAAQSSSTYYSSATVNVINYNNTISAKNVLLDNYYLKDQPGLQAVRMANAAGWLNTAAVTSLTFVCSSGLFAVGSRITIYDFA